MLVGVPLGLSSKRGGKSTGFVLTILLVFVYYFVSSVGIALATQGKVSPFLGVWGANLVFAIAGALLLQQMSRGGIALSLLSALGVYLSRGIAHLRKQQPQRAEVDISMQLPQRLRSVLRIRFPLILDEYIMRAFASNVALVLTSFSMLFIIFTFFELIGDIIRNRTALVTVGDYLLNLIPYIIYNTTPLCVLVAVLITFCGLARTSEFTAMKSAGFSLYRIVTPVLVLTAMIAVSLFVFDDFYLPAANRRQEALRSVIKGRPAQTFLRPDRQWMSGQSPNQQPTEMPTQLSVRPPGLPDTATDTDTPRRATEPTRIFYYQAFSADNDAFLNLTVFEFDLGHLHTGAAHLRPVRSLGSPYRTLDLRKRLGSILRRRDRRHLPALRPDDLPRHPRAAAVLQKRRPSVAGDELLRTLHLYRRPAAIRYDRHAKARRAAQSQDRLPRRHAGHGDARDPLCARDRQTLRRRGVRGGDPARGLVHRRSQPV